MVANSKSANEIRTIFKWLLEEMEKAHLRQAA
jgi:hypothetical protein